MKTSLVALFSLTAAATAANLTWNPAGSSDLLDADNWSGGSIPTGADALQFTADGDYEVMASGPLTAASMNVLKGKPVFWLSPWTLTLGSNLDVNQGADFSLGSGALSLGGSVTVGNDALPSQMHLFGPTTRLNAAGITFGSVGTGHSVVVASGAKVRTTGNIAIGNWANDCEVVVEGAGSELCSEARLFVGGSGLSNRLLIRNGGYVEARDGNWNYLYVGNDAKSKFNEIVVTGEGSVLQSGDAYLGNYGYSNTIYVLDGGLYNCTNNLSLAARGGWGNRLVVTNATFNHLQEDRRTTLTIERGSELIISGPEARGTFNFLTANQDCLVHFCDGAVITNAGHWNIGHNNANGPAHMIVSNATIHSGYNINAGNFINNCSIQVLDGGRIDNPNFFFDIGSQKGATNNFMIVDGADSYVSADRFRIGGESSNCWARISNGGTVYSGSVEIGSTANASGNWIEVVDGGLLTGPKNANVYFGRTNPPNNARESMLLVRNGTIDYWAGNSIIHMRGNGRFRIEGATTKVMIPWLECQDAVLEFVPPEGAEEVAEPYITTRGTVTIGPDAVLRVVGAEKCALAGGGRYTLLLNTNQDFTGSFQHVEAGPDVTVTQTARSIEIRVADRSNTLILLR